MFWKTHISENLKKKIYYIKFKIFKTHLRSENFETHIKFNEYKKYIIFKNKIKKIK